MTSSSRSLKLARGVAAVAAVAAVADEPVVRR
jgi:hypothetical protein